MNNIEGQFLNDFNKGQEEVLLVYKNYVTDISAGLP